MASDIDDTMTDAEEQLHFDLAKSKARVRMEIDLRHSVIDALTEEVNEHISRCQHQLLYINELEAKLEAMHTMARTQLDSPSTVKQQSGYVVCNTICTIYESF